MPYDPNGASSAGTANTYMSLSGQMKKQPTATQKKRSFAKIRKVIEGKR